MTWKADSLCAKALFVCISGKTEEEGVGVMGNRIWSGWCMERPRKKPREQPR